MPAAPMIEVSMIRAWMPEVPMIKASMIGG
jgi:hypothetical protein